MPEITPPPARPRLDAIDFLRGLVMILMALDHTRDFFGRSGMNPTDVNDPALFLTRWVTHFCAPTFVFLAGVSAFLYGQRGRTTAEVSRFLLTRGLWLILLEVTVVRTGWTFGFGLSFFVLQVIWAIGCSLLVLGLLVWLPRWAIAAFGLLLIGGHNFFDSVKAADLGGWSGLWKLLHQQSVIQAGGTTRLFPVYPLVPWLGLAAAGYSFAPVLLRPEAERRRWLLGLGGGVLLLFVGLRATSLYGDPAPRLQTGALVQDFLSFLNCEKYPPSLLYLCMTIGPLLLALGLLGEIRSRLGRAVVVFGRVPMLYYVVHLYLIHGLAVVYVWIREGALGNTGPGFGLPGVYLVTLLVVLLLYPLCAWFAALKARRREAWLSYL